MPGNTPEKELTLGQHLEVARQQAGYSLRQLANLSGVHVSVVNRLLKDEVEQPVPAHLVALARALELNATDLFVLAGLPVTEDAASLEVMLRKSYGVNDEQVAELKRQIEALIAEHTQQPNADQQ